MISPFVHLHVHSHYSTLDGACKIPELINKALDCRMSALALTDHGNMFGIKEFADLAKPKAIKGAIDKELKKIKEKSGDNPSPSDQKKIEKLQARLQFVEEHGFKPILGCEVYIAPQSRFDKKDSKNDAAKADGENLSKYNHLILLAKNATGYKNLIQLVSLGYTEGYYYKPRIDKEILEKYHEGIIACSACIAGEIPQLILKGDMQKAEEVLLWYKQLFGEDFYLELQRHQTVKPGTSMDVFPQQEKVNPILLELGKKHNIKCIATNDVHFLNEADADAHDVLLCISTAARVSDEKRLRYTQQEWFKSAEEMQQVFSDLPEILGNTLEIANKVETYDLHSEPLMPSFEIPEDFQTDDIPVYFQTERVQKKLEAQGEKGRRENLFLRHLTYQGAYKRYGEELSPEIKERIDFELETIAGMGFPGYFLIVYDFIAAARNLGVSVGPGRGSAAGSVVAYCLRITDLDPFKYDLLFERFLNPDRISLPDIDIDFDEDGRARVLQWVTNKYGADKVAHIITYGTMAAKSAINDVGRAYERTPAQSKALTKIFTKETKNIAAVLKTDEMKEAIKDPENAKVMQFAEQLENTIRQTGVHACGVIIAPDSVSKFAPIATNKDKKTGENILVTQYEGKCVEDVGLIKMDFLGLTTLSIIQDALSIIRQRNGSAPDIDNIPLDDPKTFELYSKGETTGTFQFESAGMKKYLRELKPTTIDDLIAMNALYRPGPIQYIPNFIARKHGREPITYDLPEMESRLKDTYGITVYQEQVMLLSRDLAGFTRGQSDELRKAMGKKLIDKLNDLEAKFIDGCKKNGHTDEKIISKIWNDWKAFASYAFNKSHAACYSWLAYQTAYLKAHYPAEYMAACLGRSLDKPDDTLKFMVECRRMGIEVLPPDINESFDNFMVNAKGQIRYGMAAIKGVGLGAAQSIVKERERAGNYSDIFDFVSRVDLSSCNKRVVEALGMAGAFSSLPNFKREHLFAQMKGKTTFGDQLLAYGANLQQNRTQNAMFGSENLKLPEVDEWSLLERLRKEQEVLGRFLSGHPLDPYAFEMAHMVSLETSRIDDMDLASHMGTKYTVGGIVTSSKVLTGKSGKPYLDFTLDDYSGSYRFRLFGNDVEKYKPIVQADEALFLTLTVSKRYDDQPELKITKIELLQDVKNNIRKLNIHIRLDDLNDSWISELYLQVQNNPGNIPLLFTVIETETEPVQQVPTEEDNSTSDSDPDSDTDDIDLPTPESEEDTEEGEDNSEDTEEPLRIKQQLVLKSPLKVGLSPEFLKYLNEHHDVKCV